MSKLKYVSSENLLYVTTGLTFEPRTFANVLDAVLIEVNEQTQIPDAIVEWNTIGGFCREPLSFPERGQLIIEATALLKSNGSKMHVAQAKFDFTQPERTPAVHLNLHSPSLDIPMRVEIPLRAIVKGDKPIAGTYCIYLHVLIDDAGQEFVYYGLTKRGWNQRFHEHLELALKEESHRSFPRKLSELIKARSVEKRSPERARTALDLSDFSQESGNRKLAGVVSTLCVVGLDRDAAMDSEEYLVDKYSLSSKHPFGLNMLPGGYEGMRALHRLALRTRRDNLETHEREAVLDKFLRQNQRAGVAKPGISTKWNDPQYAEAVICGRENRLSADQVRLIRYLAANGMSAEKIKSEVGAIDAAQVSKVIHGKTYSRIE